MNILFLFPYPISESPSQRFRFEQYLNLLTTKSINYDAQSFWDMRSWKILYKKGHLFTKFSGLLRGFIRRFAIIFKINRYDFVFIHRECAPIGPPVIEWMIARIFSKKIIYDFDDAIWLTDQKGESKVLQILKWRSKVSAICRWSYRVSCGNDYLKSFAMQFNPHVIFNPTTIDTQHLHQPALYKNNADRKNITIGWTGTHSTLPYLNQLADVLSQLEKTNPGVQIMIIANHAPVLPLTSLQFIPWRISTEVEDLLQFDIGIMPLTDDEWTQGKCGFKALQYMALEIPSIVSAVGVNTKIIDDGVDGFTCQSKEEWMDKLRLLIENPELRSEIGKRGRLKVEKSYSVSSNSANFLSLFFSNDQQ